MKARASTCVAIRGRGVLIEGAPGTGKSSLALALLDRGAQLVGDDGVMIEPVAGRLHVFAHPRIRGLIEVRNLGLMPMPVCDEAIAALVVKLEHDAPRYVEAADTIEIEGVTLPQVTLWPDSPINALKAELALERFGI